MTSQAKVLETLHQHCHLLGLISFASRLLSSLDPLQALKLIFESSLKQVATLIFRNSPGIRTGLADSTHDSFKQTNPEADEVVAVVKHL